MTSACAAVLVDLDGTLLDTETIVDEVAARVIEGLGAEYTPTIAALGRGKRPLEACAAVVSALSLPITPEELYARTDAELVQRWGEARLLPGAERLVRHLAAAGVPLALVTSTPKATLALKRHALGDLFAAFRAVVTGDDVARGKPAPDAFLAAAAALGVAAEDCAAVEDAPSGVEAARAAGCRVVLAVPSMRLPPGEAACYAGPRTVVLRSLLDVEPAATLGLPAFADWIEGVLPLPQPLLLRGPVVRGFGRGSKMLGIPTANLDAAEVLTGVAASAAGIYAGWASVGADAAVHPMCMSVGYNPFFKGSSKTVEPWILAQFPTDFYGQQLRLCVAAYIRPEADFTTLEALVARIHADADVTRAALAHPALLALRDDAFLAPPPAAAA